LRRQRRPASFDHSEPQLHGANRPPGLIASILIERALDTNRTGRGEVRLFAADDAPISDAVDHDNVRVHIGARHLFGDHLALEIHDPGMQLLLEVGEAPGLVS